MAACIADACEGKFYHWEIMKQLLLKHSY